MSKIDREKKSEKKNNKARKLKEEEIKAAFKPAPWIKMRTGMIVVGIASIVMAVLTGIQTIPQLGWGEGLLWSLLFGGMIWAIFFGNLAINKFLRRG